MENHICATCGVQQAGSDTPIERFFFRFYRLFIIVSRTRNRTGAVFERQPRLIMIRSLEGSKQAGYQLTLTSLEHVVVPASHTL